MPSKSTHCPKCGTPKGKYIGTTKGGEGIKLRCAKCGHVRTSYSRAARRIYFNAVLPKVVKATDNQ